MCSAIRTRVIKIGNSQGIRIPKPLLEQSGIGEEVEIEVQDDQLIIRSATHPRRGWDSAFEAMATQKDDALLDADLSTIWDESEWEW